MAEWKICPSCNLRHSARADGLCPRCHKPLEAGAHAVVVPSASPSGRPVLPEDVTVPRAAEELSGDSTIDVVPADVPSFGAGKAFAAFVILLLTQIVVGLVMGLRGAVIAAGSGTRVRNTEEFTRMAMQETMVPFLLVVSVVSALVVYVIARAWAWHLVVDRSEFGLGIRPLPAGHVVRWLAVGLILGLGYVALSVGVPADPSKSLGPLATLAMGGGTGFLVWAALAIIYAPIVEEFFFRGLLFTGFSNSSGEMQAGVLVTILFIVMHLSETWMYWPATLAVGLMAVATLAARVMTGSLYAAVAVHLAYNAVLVVYTYLFPPDV